MSNKEHKTSLSNGSGSGFGEFDFLDGSKYEGEFKDGKEWKGKDYNKDGNIIQTWLNGKNRNKKSFPLTFVTIFSLNLFDLRLKAIE